MLGYFYIVIYVSVLNFKSKISMCVVWWTPCKTINFKELSQYCLSLFFWPVNTFLIKKNAHYSKYFSYVFLYHYLGCNNADIWMTTLSVITISGVHYIIMNNNANYFAYRPKSATKYCISAVIKILACNTF